MKKMFTFLAMMVIVSFGFAQWNNDRELNNYGQHNTYQNSALIVGAYAQGRFTVVVDNRFNFLSNGNIAIIGNVSAGNHTITVYE